ncbi:hypothetical protein Aduo_009321 [Ancylostoma duodenale]
MFTTDMKEAKQKQIRKCGATGVHPTDAIRADIGNSLERPPPPVEELPRRRRKQVDPEHPTAPPRLDHFDPRDPRLQQQQPFDPRDPRAQFLQFEPRDPQHQDPRRQGRPVPVDKDGRPIQPKRIPLDQYGAHVDARYPGRLFRPEDLARIPHDSFGRPLVKVK